MNGTDFTAEVSPGPPVGRLLPALSPAAPAFRAIPFPEVTEPFCRLPLPTLFYRPEAVYLGDLLRIWVRFGATSHEPSARFSRFHPTLMDTARTAVLFAIYTKTHSLLKEIPGPQSLMQKRQLFPEFGWTSLALIVLPREIRGSQRLRYRVQE